MTRSVRSIPRGTAAWIFALFFVWSNSFTAISFLLGSERAAPRLDWVELPVLRFLTAAAVCALYCFGFRARESLGILRRRWRRLLAAGFFCVPAYNLALAYGQQHGIPPPVASLETALAPLFLMLLGAALLGEELSETKVAGFLAALGGLGIIASTKDPGTGFSYPGVMAVTALAPLSWSLYTVISKPAQQDCPPVLWSYLAIIAGTVPLALIAPWRGAAALARLDAPGWLAILYLAFVCTLAGFAVWTWLLKRMPASSLGFTVFLNPPMTTVSQALLALAAPGVFVQATSGREWAGGLLVLGGIALALFKRPSSARVPAAEPESA